MVGGCDATAFGVGGVDASGTAVTLLAVAVLVMVHVFGGRMRFLDQLPRSRWLSFAGGISISYVFLHLLPGLGSAQQDMGGESGPLPWLEHHAYLVALSGLALWYGLEIVLRRTRSTSHAEVHQQATGSGSNPGDSHSPMPVFWLHIGAFSVYNALVGYLIVHREQPGLLSLATFTLALGLHFLVNDVALRRDHRDDYRHLGRWLLAGSALAGWLLAQAVDVGAMATGAMFAFLAGGVMLNVLKEELPEEGSSQFWAFALGCVSFAALLLAGDWLEHD